MTRASKYLVCLCLLALGGEGRAEEPPKPTRVLKKHGGPVQWVDFSQDGRFLFTAGGRRICRWDLTTGKLAGEFRDEIDFAYKPALSLDRKRIAFMANGGSEIQVGEVETGKVVFHLKRNGRVSYFVHVALSPDGGLLAGVQINPTAVHL
jgi:WD40 repeat protein